MHDKYCMKFKVMILKYLNITTTNLTNFKHFNTELYFLHTCIKVWRSVTQSFSTNIIFL